MQKVTAELYLHSCKQNIAMENPPFCSYLPGKVGIFIPSNRPKPLATLADGDTASTNRLTKSFKQLSECLTFGGGLNPSEKYAQVKLGWKSSPIFGIKKNAFETT